MTRRTLLCVPLAACVRADSADDIKLLMDSAATALRNRNEKQFLAAFDPAMKDYRQLAANVHGLLRDADVQASIEIANSEMQWTLEIAAHDSSAGETVRHVKTTYATGQSSGKLRIAAFDPISLFAPPHGREAWDVISAVARDLQLASRASQGRQENDLPAVLERFDRAMPGFAQLQANLKGLTSTWQIEPALQLTGNEGSDVSRRLEIDWSLTLTDPVDGGRSVRRQETVKCVVEQRGKQWLIVSFAPLELFAP